TGIARHIERDGRDMLAAAEEIHLDQMNPAVEQLLLLLPIEVAAVLAGRLVRQAEHLDRGDQSLALLAAGVDLDERLAEFIGRGLSAGPPADNREGSSREARLEGLPKIRDEAIVEVREDLRTLQIRVHAGKG